MSRGEVAAAEALIIIGQVAQEVDILERRSQLPCAVLEPGDLSGGAVEIDEEDLEAHESDDLGGPEDVLGMFLRVEAADRRRGRRLGPTTGTSVRRFQVCPHGGEERVDELSVDAGCAGGPGEGMDDEVVTDAVAQRRVGGGGEPVQHLPLLGLVKPRFEGQAIDNLIGNADQCVDIADMVPVSGSEQSDRKTERGRIARDHGPGRIFGGSRVELIYGAASRRHVR